MRGRPTTLTTTEGPSDGMRVIRKVVPYFWPKDDPKTRVRVVVALVLLALSKAFLAATPVVYGWAVDALARDSSAPAMMLAIGAVGLTVAYGMARVMANGFQQLRNVFFAPVSNAALRALALETFNHIHALSMRYHITRKTGGSAGSWNAVSKACPFSCNFSCFPSGRCF